MTDQEEQGAAKDIPPWLQPVPEIEEEGSFFARRKGTIITAGVAVVLLGVFGAAIFTLYEDSPQGEPRRIAAEQGPVRQKPDEPGGMEIAHQDKQVFDAAAGVPAGGSVSLGVQPEQPVKEIPDLPEEKPTVVAASGDEKQDTIGDIAEAAMDKPAEGPASARANTPPPTAEPEPETAEPAASVPSTSAPAIDTSAYWVQLGAYGSERGAENAWRTVRGKFPNQLSDLSPIYPSVDTGGRTLYRLRVGPIATRGAADQVCIALRAQQQACIVVNPS